MLDGVLVPGGLDAVAVTGVWNRRPSDGSNRPQDSAEAKLSTAVCSGKIQLAAAQSTIATRWTTAPAKLGLT
uniref:Uncharacterized protein n=1 Tax=Streptomyces sp. NBC_00003 TaxID=2903608 RepID=A0AAU2VFH8_9ACTN